MTANLDALGEFEDDTKALFSAVGFIVVQWGQAEQCLELISHTLFQEFGGKRLASEHKLPKMLGRKVAFVRKCFNKIPAVAEFKTEALEMLDLFNELADDRHNVIHGAITSMSEVDGAFEFLRLEHNDAGYLFTTYRLEGHAFPTLAKKLVRMGGIASKLEPKLMRKKHPTRREPP